MTPDTTTEVEDVFKAQFRKTYGLNMGVRGPDYTKCAEGVMTYIGRWPSHHQCSRKNGYGPHGAWCKQHNPEAVKAKREAEDKAWRERRDKEELLRDLEAEKLVIIRQIAGGHNDPRALCLDYLSRLDVANGRPAERSDAAEEGSSSSIFTQTPTPQGKNT